MPSNSAISHTIMMLELSQQQSSTQIKKRESTEINSKATNLLIGSTNIAEQFESEGEKSSMIFEDGSFSYNDSRIIKYPSSHVVVFRLAECTIRSE